MNTLKIDDTEIPVPGRWDELSAEQLTALTLLLSDDREVLSVALRALLILLDAPAHPWRQQQLLLMNDEQRYNCLQLAKWVFDPAGTITRQLLPVLKVPADLRRVKSAETLHGPGDGFAGLVFQEFIQCEGHRADYAQRGDEKYLNLLVAALYRPARRGPVTAENADGDVREKYNDHLVQARALRVARIPRGQRLAVLRYYDSNRRQRIEAYRGTLFEALDPEAAPQLPTDPRPEWHKTLAELAGSVMHYDAVAFQPLDSVLFDLDLKITKNRERLAELEKQAP